MASAKHSSKAKTKSLHPRHLRASLRAKEYYSEFADNVRDNYIPRFLHIEDLIYGVQEESKQDRVHANRHI